MLDEPHRWVEAVENRREYIEDRLRVGSPVVGLSYDQGIRILTLTAGEPKVFEIYDRMALSAVGHPADIEKLRMLLIDMAHVEGFSKSQADVTLHRLVNFGLIPVLKQAFDAVFGSPFLVKLLAAELGQGRRPNQFYAVQYDGELQIHRGWGAVTGTEEADRQVTAYLEEHAHAITTRESAIEVALRAWALGHFLTREEESSEMPGDEALWQRAQDLCGKHTVDAAVLEETIPGSSKFRRLDAAEIEAILTA